MASPLCYFNIVIELVYIHESPTVIEHRPTRLRSPQARVIANKLRVLTDICIGIRAAKLILSRVVNQAIFNMTSTSPKRIYLPSTDHK